MKHFVVCVVLFCSPTVFGSFSPDIDIPLHQNERECSILTGISSSELEAIRQNRKVSNDPKSNAFAKCILEKFNVMYPDGSLNSNVSSYGIPHDTNSLDLLAPSCLSLGGSDAGDLANKVMNCLLDGNQLVLGLRPNELL